MSSDTPEPLAAILAEMREAGRSDEHADGPLIEDYADRIEAAVKRERAQWHAETNAAKEERNRIACRMRYEFAAKCRACKATPGNAAATREALEEQSRYWWSHIRNYSENEMLKRTDAALAAPARNCDVGTADEQAERFEAECHRHDHCTPCPVHRVWGEFKEGKPKSCQLIWAQMPFASAEGGAE